MHNKLAPVAIVISPDVVPCSGTMHQIEHQQCQDDNEKVLSAITVPASY